MILILFVLCDTRSSINSGVWGRAVPDFVLPRLFEYCWMMAIAVVIYVSSTYRHYFQPARRDAADDVHSDCIDTRSFAWYTCITT